MFWVGKNPKNLFLSIPMPRAETPLTRLGSTKEGDSKISLHLIMSRGDNFLPSCRSFIVQIYDAVL